MRGENHSSFEIGANDRELLVGENKKGPGSLLADRPQAGTILVASERRFYERDGGCRRTARRHFTKHHPFGRLNKNSPNHLLSKTWFTVTIPFQPFRMDHRRLEQNLLRCVSQHLSFIVNRSQAFPPTIDFQCVSSSTLIRDGTRCQVSALIFLKQKHLLG
jgi:hypothetical protein